MTGRNSDTTLAALTQKLVSETDGEKVSIADAMDVMDYRGFGPLLLIPSIVTLLPTGAVPGVPAVCGVFMILLSLQIALGRKRPWLPEIIKKMSLPRQKLETAISDKKSFIAKIDNLLVERLEFLTKEKAQRATGLIISLLAVAMIGLGFIPFAPDLFALPILFFALAYTAQDGLFALIGYAFVAVALAFLPWMFGWI